MSTKSKMEPQNPLILRCHRLMDAFAKSNDERDFFLDRMEGFILYFDLDKSENEIINLEKEVEKNTHRYVLIPKLTFYETKKIMEGFVNEKVYDIDTKEKLLDIIQSKEARENFLEFIFDHHSEYEKWQQFYQERSRIRIIEWLRQNNFYFVFEEDLELPRKIVEGLKRQLFQTKVSKDVAAARKTLIAKAKTYYSSEALNPRPKRGRPPKQAIKAEVEPQITGDIYTTVPPAALPFLYTPDITSLSAITFSAKFESEEDLVANKKHGSRNDGEISIESFNEKLASLRSLSNKWLPQEPPMHSPSKGSKIPPKKSLKPDFDEDEDDEFDADDISVSEDIDESDFEGLDDDDGDEDEDFAPVSKKKTPPPKPASPAKPKLPPAKAKAPAVKAKAPIVKAKAPAAKAKAPVAKAKAPVLKAKAKPVAIKSKGPVPVKKAPIPKGFAKKLPPKKVEKPKTPVKAVVLKKAPPKKAPIAKAPIKKPAAKKAAPVSYKKPFAKRR